ncbi:hypothetical protein [Flavobacterium aquicola]|uniref:Uncharacterized protein n=1 Tax=Flavobacterium aquicola TaxID=1682742 RepID=A0A3E0EL22_9FLAO|nr:hypothetical protein [Flavobacterium aquicola]REG98871.1 hypothetical protein C8P67_10530 [Flavobacterium aquicola]
MKNNPISNKEYIYLAYSYASISTFLLLTISRVTETLEKALHFNPIVSVVIVLNMITFITTYVNRKNIL